MIPLREYTRVSCDRKGTVLTGLSDYARKNLRYPMFRNDVGGNDKRRELTLEGGFSPYCMNLHLVDWSIRGVRGVISRPLR